MGGKEVNGESEPHILCEGEAMLGFALHFGERIARRKKVRVQLGVAVPCIIEIASPDEPVRNFVCEAFSMTTRSMNATQDEDRCGGQGGAAAVLG